MVGLWPDEMAQGEEWKVKLDEVKVPCTKIKGRAWLRSMFNLSMNRWGRRRQPPTCSSVDFEYLKTRKYCDFIHSFQIVSLTGVNVTSVFLRRENGQVCIWAENADRSNDCLLTDPSDDDFVSVITYLPFTDTFYEESISVTNNQGKLITFPSM